MIALYILLGALGFLLLLVLLVGSLKLSVRAGYCQTPLLIVGIGPLRLSLVGGERKEREEAPAPPESGKKRKKKKKKPKKPKKRKESARPAEEVALTDLLSAFLELLNGLFRDFKKHLCVETFRLRVLVASDDAAKTALEYGVVCSLAYEAGELTLQAKRVKKENVNVNVECDFLADKPEIDVELFLSASVCRLGVIGLRAFRRVLNTLSLLRAYSDGRKAKKEKESEQKKG